jgi:hypothetical protein
MNTKTDKQMEKLLVLLTESGSGSDNIKLNKKKRIFQKYKVTNAEEAADRKVKVENTSKSSKKQKN